MRVFMMLSLSMLSLLAIAQEKSAVGAMELDRNMIVPESVTDGVAWYDPGKAPFVLSGFPWYGKEKVFRRLPADPDKKLPEAVDILAMHCAGGTVRFATDSDKLLIRVKLTTPAGRMYHMAATGESGFDLYMQHDGGWKYVSTSGLTVGKSDYTATMLSGKKQAGARQYLLNFPLYNGVAELEIGFAESAKLYPVEPWLGKKIVIYGGSTVQGACASRPGRCAMSIVGRALDCEVVNLGFSGNGKMEPRLAELINEIPDVGLLLIEAERNTNYDGLVEKLENFIAIIRSKSPDLAIILWSANPRSGEYHLEPLRKSRIKNLDFMQSVVDKLKDKNLYLYDSSNLLGDDYYECSVDGSHPTDLGFDRMARGIIPFIQNIMNRKN